MPTATVLKKNISKKQLIIIGSVIGGVALIGIIYFTYVFLTGARPSQASEDAPQNVQVVEATADKVQVKWSTPTEAVTAIQYGTEPDAASFKSLPASGSPNTQHSIDISSLEPGVTYYFQIVVGEETFNNEGSFWSFTTPKADGTGSEATSEAKLSPSPGSGSIVPTQLKQPQLLPRSHRPENRMRQIQVFVHQIAVPKFKKILALPALHRTTSNVY